MHDNSAMTRRRFIGSALATSALVLSKPGAALAQAGKTASTSGVELCAFEKPFQFLSYDETAEVFAEAGFDGIEAAVRAGGHVLPERVEEDLPRMVEALEKRGLKMTILTSDINSLDQPHAEKVLRKAASLGVKRYRMLWYRYDLKKPILPQLDAVRAKLERLAAFNRDLGLSALYQNHAGQHYVGAPLWDIYTLLKEFDPRDVGIAFDIRHAIVEGGLSWPLQFQLVKSHVTSLFVKDFTWENGKVKNVPLGEGRVTRESFTTVKQGFSGPISLHVEYLDKVQDRRVLAEAFKKDLATLRSWL